MSRLVCAPSVFAQLIGPKIGQALRISVTKVLNKKFPEALRSSNFEYQRRLWWTVYCIDRKCAAMLGSPSVMRDDDISIPFPEIKPGDESQNAFAIHAILSSHLGKILDGELVAYVL